MNQFKESQNEHNFISYKCHSENVHIKKVSSGYFLYVCKRKLFFENTKIISILWWFADLTEEVHVQKTNSSKYSYHYFLITQRYFMNRSTLTMKIYISFHDSLCCIIFNYKKKMLYAHRQLWHDRDLLQSSVVNSIFFCILQQNKQSTIYIVLSHL